MSQDQPQRPVNYGDVFPLTQAQGNPLADQPVTMEDASLMQTAEALTFGHTQKGGAASAMQSAASRNVDLGLVERDAHTFVADLGFSVAETAVPGAVVDVSYVAGTAVAGSASPTPTDPLLAALEAVTIGEALEVAAVRLEEKPVDESDARAIQSAETRATGVSAPMRGGVAALAQSAAKLNQRLNSAEQTTIADILTDATTLLPADKVVTREDAEKVLEAERRGTEGIRSGGIGAAMATAAELNERTGWIAPPAMAAGYFTLDQSIGPEADAIASLGGGDDITSGIGLTDIEVMEGGDGDGGERVPRDEAATSVGGDGARGGEEMTTPLLTGDKDERRVD